MPPIDSLKSWFEQHVRFATWSDVDTTIAKPDEMEIRFSTQRFTYTIYASVKADENYLGCTCLERERRRGRDLPDGAFSEETWTDIVQAIVDNEIIPTRPPRGRSR